MCDDDYESLINDNILHIKRCEEQLKIIGIGMGAGVLKESIWRCEQNINRFKKLKQLKENGAK